MESVICIGGDWGRNPSTAQFIARGLAREHRVLWVNSLGLRPPRLTRADLSRMARKVRERRQGLRGVNGANVHVLTPLLLPAYAVPAVRRLNGALLRAELLRAARCLGMARPVLMVANPAAAVVVGRLGERRSVYYCADEWTDLPGMPRKTVERLEADLCARADLTIVTSERLRRRKAFLARRVALVRHGVDHPHFAAALDPATPVPEDVGRLPRPRIGFHGLVQDIVDFELVRELAERRPTWSFVFVGPRTFDTGWLPEVPNVHFLGRREYAEIPCYLKAFDVGLVPFRITERTLHANPVKLREYLAAGLPVVSVPLPEVEPYAPEVRVAETAAGFLEAAEAALCADSLDARRRRSASVASESWDAVAQQVADLLLG